MKSETIVRGDLLRTAGRTARVVGVHHVPGRGVFIKLDEVSSASKSVARPFTVSLDLLRRLSACGMDVCVIRRGPPPRRRTRRPDAERRRVDRRLPLWTPKA